MNAPNPQVSFFTNDIRAIVADLNTLAEEIIAIESSSLEEFKLEAFRDAIVRVRNVRLALEAKLPADKGGAS